MQTAVSLQIASYMRQKRKVEWYEATGPIIGSTEYWVRGSVISREIKVVFDDR